MIKKEDDILKFKDFIIEIQPIWNVREKLVLVITGATGTMSK